MNIKRLKDYILRDLNFRPDLAIVLGSGLGNLAENISNQITIKYKDIEDFPVSTVEGHNGQFVLGQICGKNVIAMQGRLHYYEGYTIEETVKPIRFINSLGINSIIITNAAGAVNESFEPGDLMIINDHINFSGKNPLIGSNNDDLGPRFLDMTYSYDRDYINLIHSICKEININIQEGIYMWFSGPTYETPAEVRMARTLGADAVGMSTVPEVIVSRHEGVRVIGISCITNMAAGVLDQALDHSEVIAISKKSNKNFVKLLMELIRRM